MSRTWERIGGWCALAAGLLGVVKLAVAAALFAAVEPNRALGAASPHPDGRTASVLLALVGVALALAQLGAVRGADAALRPRTRLTATVATLGYAAAALSLLSLVYTGYGTVTPTNAGLWLSLLTGFALALWIIGVCAADWRLRRLPAWLRVTGTSAALLSFLTPILTLFVLLAVPLALVWWFGLGVSLLRIAKSPLTPADAGAQA